MDDRNAQQSADPMPVALCVAESPACLPGNQAGSGQEGGAPQPSRQCSRCGQIARKGQWSCLRCHSEEMRQYRARNRDELTRLMRELDSITVNNLPTRLAFEKKLGKRQRHRHVVVVQKVNGQSIPMFSGFVIGFHPMEKLSVIRDSGQVFRVSLEEVESDPDNGPWWSHPLANPS